MRASYNFEISFLITFALLTIVKYGQFVTPVVGQETETANSPTPPSKPNSEEDTSNSDDYYDLELEKNCTCLQKVRTNYITTDPCGRAALCYWELMNYRLHKEASKKIPYDNYRCDDYKVQKYTCKIGYPKPQFPNEECAPAKTACDQELAAELYADCEPLRASRGYLKPQDMQWKLNTKELNFDLKQDEDHIFLPGPSADRPVRNNYYAMSCPIIYRYPYLTIDLLLKDLNPNYEYDETNAVEAVAHSLPKYVREGIDNERILNFYALSLDESAINWCNIPTNYVCIRTEKDADQDICSDGKLKDMERQCQDATGGDTDTSAKEKEGA